MNWTRNNFDLLVAAAALFVMAACLILVYWAWK